MKKPIAWPLAIILVIQLFSSCVKDTCLQTYKYFKPVYRTADEVRANIKSNPAKEISNPGKIYIRGNYIFLNDADRGIHIIDNSNPRSPENIAFIDIPGNIDMAVKGNMLYADAYSDLVVIDISNPLQAKLTKVVEGVFPFRAYTTYFVADQGKVIVDWIERDTTVEVACGQGGMVAMPAATDMIFLNSACSGCQSASGGAKTGSPFGMGGSMARFTIMNNHLYTVTTSHLNVFNITNPETPEFKRDIPMGWDIETIYPFKDRLFIGSMSGMYIFNVSNPDEPVQTGTFVHARSCDPVVADDDFAYITLRSGTVCQGFNNQLDIVNITDPSNPQFIQTYAMDNPHGLSKDGNLLFVCDGKSGLKLYDAADVRNLKLLAQIDQLETYDVIAWNNVALVTARGGLYQFGYTTPYSLELLSKIELPR